MKKHTLLNVLMIVLLFYSSLISYGQEKKLPEGPFLLTDAKVEDVNTIKGRTLLVELSDDFEIRKNMKTIIEKYWKLNTNIEFLPKTEVLTKIKNDGSKYVVLSFDLVNFSARSGYGSWKNSCFRSSLVLGEKYYKKPLFFTNIETKVKNEKVLLEKKDMLFAVDFIQNRLNRQIAGKSWSEQYKEITGTLEAKTLMLDEELIDKKLTDKQLKENYPYPFKITNLKAIEEAQLSRDKRYAFVVRLPADAYDVFYHLIVNCENGRTISSGEMNNGAFDSYSNLISKDHLKSYIKHSTKPNILVKAAL